jgi:protein TonB
MVRLFLFIAALCVGLSSPVWAETEAETPVEEAIVSYKDLDVQASYPGGKYQLANDVTAAFKYPARDSAMGNEGVVQVRFIVEADGTISNPNVVKGQTLTMNREAVRIVTLLRPFSPAMKDGKPVRTALILPIQFKLES